MSLIDALQLPANDPPSDSGGSLVGRTLLIVAPAVLAAATLRPRSGSRSRHS